MSKQNKRKTKTPSTLKKKLIQKSLRIFDKNPSQSYNYKEISSELGLANGNERKLLNSILIELEATDWIKHVGNGKYTTANASSQEQNTLTGRIDFNSRGAGYLIVEGREDDIYIHSSNTGKAFQKDTVKVAVSERKGKLEGTVIEVIERNKTEFIGTIEKSAKAVFVRPDDKNMPVDFFIERGHLHGAKDGEKVKVKFFQSLHLGL
jgi:exoribonuclease R